MVSSHGHGSSSYLVLKGINRTRVEMTGMRDVDTLSICFPLCISTLQYDTCSISCQKCMLGRSIHYDPLASLPYVSPSRLLLHLLIHALTGPSLEAPGQLKKA